MQRTAPPAHRKPPVMPRSHFIGIHLQCAPQAEDPLEERAMRRAVQQEARSRRSNRRVEEVEAELEQENAKLLKRERTIEALKARLADVEHALAVAQKSSKLVVLKYFAPWCSSSGCASGYTRLLWCSHSRMPSTPSLLILYGPEKVRPLPEHGPSARTPSGGA